MGNLRDLALFNLAIDSKLQAWSLVNRWKVGVSVRRSSSTKAKKSASPLVSMSITRRKMPADRSSKCQRKYTSDAVR
ncbi:hypothetical protein OCH239_07215 [Roseivivax halodurans JCM 10272]|uniref:Uncharacterized protein n=1 Tax=Roseivivax halodurans JCM 10272 TaxID=1449350 RepID=X7EEV2_9RHOB|nr:hypothetical protein OCH239_07215 [Roseivivax halodurans JCM 10272]